VPPCSQFVDKRGIRWEIQFLENESEEVEEEQGLRGERRRDAMLVGQIYSTCS
jgi:hypothetical protein